MPDRPRFQPVDTTLSEEEQAACAKRQRHAEWGLAVARLGDIETGPELLAELQRYINGEVSLAELAQTGYPSGQSNPVYQDVAHRERFVG